MEISTNHLKASELGEMTLAGFTDHYGSVPQHIYFAPGRINLIGEHLDYNGGMVMPAAIEQGIAMAVSVNDSGLLKGYAADLSSELSISVARLRELAVLDGENLREKLKPYPTWSVYVLGVLRQWGNRFPDECGLDLYFRSSVPVGAGLSSSAALCSVVAFGFDELLGFGASRMDMAKMGQRAEIECAGLNCGLMDQFASLHGEANKVLQFDCAALTYETVPFEIEAEFILCHSGVSHELAESGYNDRRASCELGMQVLRDRGFNAAFLANANEEAMKAIAQFTDETTAKRCRYVIEEMARVKTMTQKLETNASLVELGELLYDSHWGLSQKYEVSVSELDHLVRATEEQDFVYGARMMGGGFGGCTLNLVAPKSMERFKETVVKAYREETGITPLVLVVRPSAGARKLS